MERICIFALALAACSGEESWLRLSVSLADGMPQPASLAVWLSTRQVVPLDGKALPGSLIVRHLGSGAISVEVDGLDGSTITSQGTIELTLHSGENDSTVTLGAPMGGSDGGADGSLDFGGSDGPAPDLAQDPRCPSDALFCDDFES
ncbi:MAG TPA: hypothetical protein VFF06_23680, partial [Polyangia bacterium]|nr:hypothetical protein [Polyangia bacterium]